MNARVAELFHQLADLSPEERTRYLDEHDVDSETRKEAEDLLAFASCDSAPWARDIRLAAGQALSQLDAMGRRCGPYRLDSVIGRGGMGVVYLATRVDGEVSQRAAVKLLHPGLPDSQRERFLQEREILAALSHPNIAHLLDAGRLDDGQPYLAMEYVEGKPIDVFAAGLDVRRKIGLFLKVCAAVAYLHRNLVVHRDLKPSNIIVTESGEPKLLDFGIAKILDLAADSTMTSMRMLTPDYASPEQAMGARVGTTSDIYSLGVVLYQLLTGKLPRLGEDVTAELTPPAKWTPELKGDLELILMKALRKEPQERYTAVEQFAEDLEAFLESRPIRARKGELLYRARKAARRYRFPLAAAGLALAALLVGLYVANRERVIAQRRFDDVRQLSDKLFEIDRRMIRLPGSSQVRQLIVDTSLDYLLRLATDVRSDPNLALDVGTAFMRVGRVQGVDISPNLGQSENAETNLRIAEDLIHSVLVARPSNRTAFLRSAQIAHDRMILAQARRPDSGAMPLARESEQWLEKYLATGKIDEAEKEQVVIVGMNVANWYVLKGLLDEGLHLLHRTIGIARSTNQPRQAGGAQIVVARAQRSTGHLDEALAAIDEGVHLLQPPPLDPNARPTLAYGKALGIQGEILGQDNGVSLGRYREAAEYFERAYRISADLSGRDSHDAYSRLAFSTDGIRLAGVIRHSDPRRALAIYQEVLRRMAEVKNNPRARRDEVRALAWSTYPLRQMGRSRDARQNLDAAFSRLRDLKLYPTEQVAPGSEAVDTLRALAEFEAGSGNVQRGIGIYQELLTRIMASQPEPDFKLADAAELSDIYAAMGALHRLARQPELAATIEARRLALWQAWLKKLPNNAFVLRQISTHPNSGLPQN